MRVPVYTRQFERDIKRAEKRAKNLDKFKIIAPLRLPQTHRTR